jgi:NTE family protein
MTRSTGFALAAIFLLSSPVTCLAQSPVAAAVMSKQKALVLGGGGEVGEAWESGIVAGLAEKGVDLSHADLIIGTSAGAIVGARLAIGRPADLMKAVLVPPEGPLPPPPAGPPPDLSMLMRKFQEMDSGQRPLQEIRAEIGAWALKAPPVTSENEFVASYMRRFPDQPWPSRAFECTAIDTADGSLRRWNKNSGVPLARAVASSCAVPGLFAPVTINWHRYMDGGMRSASNADLAKDYKTIVVIAVALGPSEKAISKRFGPVAAALLSPATLESELKTLREGGSTVEFIAPDAASLKAFGHELGDASRRVPAANAGLLEGRKRAAEIRAAWND